MIERRKHILFLTSWFPDRVLQDNGDFIQRHAQAIALKNKVTVVHAVKDETLKKKRFELNISREKEVKEIIVYVKPSRFKPFNLLYLLQGYLLGIKHVKSFDIIHLNVIYPAGIIAIYLRKKFKKPLVLTEHWTSLHFDHFQKLAKYKQIIIRKILSSFDLVLPVSQHLGESIKKINSSIHFQVIPNVVDLSKFSIQEKKDFQKKQFLHLSHLGEHHKNILGMLNVVKRLANDGLEFEFHIGGNGDLNPIYQFIKGNNLQDYIFPFGRLNHEEVNAKMNNANCFVLFSNYENQPCVQAESFACGLPIIATDVGGIKEFFPLDFGILIEKGNEDELYFAMRKVINEIQFASPKIMNAYAEKHFSSVEISKRFDEIYIQILK